MEWSTDQVTGETTCSASFQHVSAILIQKLPCSNLVEQLDIPRFCGFAVFHHVIVPFTSKGRIGHEPRL